jgi:putative intracellular protease/amidase
MKVLMVLSAIGYHWDEALIPYNAWQSRGWDITIATPGGALPLVDPNSIRVRPLLQLFGYGTSGKRAAGEPGSIAFQRSIASPVSIDSVVPEQFDAIYLVGGHGCLFDLHGNAALDAILVSMIEVRKPVAAICHAASVLADITTSDGQRLLSHYVMTGFPTMLEHFLLLVGWVDARFRPLPVWTGHILDKNVVRPAGLRLVELADLTKTVVSDHIITGVGPKAAAALAKAMIELAPTGGSKRQNGLRESPSLPA